MGDGTRSTTTLHEKKKKNALVGSRYPRKCSSNSNGAGSLGIFFSRRVAYEGSGENKRGTHLERSEATAHPST